MQTRLSCGSAEVRVAEGGQPDPGRVEVQPLHVLAAGPVEDGPHRHRLRSQQEVPQRYQGHVSGECQFRFISNLMDIDILSTEVFGPRTKLQIELVYTRETDI